MMPDTGPTLAEYLATDAEQLGTEADSEDVWRYNALLSARWALTPPATHEAATLLCERVLYSDAWTTRAAQAAVEDASP